jgi:predicted alpha/beta superfamily hydrolase
MKKLHLIVCLVCCFYFTQAQQSNDIVIGKIETIESKILKEERKVWVYVPEQNDDGIFLKKNYPVVYLLDGDAHFYSVVGMIQQLSSVNGNTLCPKMIVVGIPNTNRTRDLTPTKGVVNPFADSSMIANSGGGDAFMAFIEEELIPQIEEKYPTEPYRMFIGHSLGGLMVMNTLIHKPHLFNAYVSIDPSMWWGNKKLLKEIKGTKFDQKYRNKSLYLGIANTLSEGMDLESVQDDTTFPTEHIRAILELNTLLENDTQKQLSYKGKFYENDDHGSVPLITEYDALRFIFDFYKLKLDMQDYLNPESDLVNKIVDHYKHLSKKFGREIKPEEAYVNGMGYQFMNMQQLNKSEQFFKLNVANYPESFNVYDSLGDFYAATGET